MTDERTPEQKANMEALDEAVAKYAAENLLRQGVVTGWVLCTATSRMTEDGDMIYAFDYSCGPQMDLIRAVGLLHACNIQLEHDVTSGHLNPDDEPG